VHLSEHPLRVPGATDPTVDEHGTRLYNGTRWPFRHPLLAPVVVASPLTAAGLLVAV
jgi:hypothetical protein